MKGNAVAILNAIELAKNTHNLISLSNDKIRVISLNQFITLSSSVRSIQITISGFYHRVLF